MVSRTLVAAALSLLLSPPILCAKEPAGCVDGSCHLAVQKRLKKSPFVHEPARDGSCTACHEPHANGRPGKLRKPLGAVCYGCHDDVGSRVRGGKSVHRMIAQDKCQACHDPHGSEREHLLVAPLAPAGRVRPDASDQELCWRCHKRELATASGVSASTRFRNGSRNLHALHLNGPKGVTCGGCHDPHAGSAEKLLDGVGKGTGGSGKAASGFTRTAEGGACIVACHKERRYDRVKPVRP